MPLVVALVLSVFAWPNSRLAPRDLPVGVAGLAPAAEAIEPKLTQQLMPPGAGANLLRSTGFFDGAGAGEHLLVLRSGRWPGSPPWWRWRRASASPHRTLIWRMHPERHDTRGQHLHGPGRRRCAV